MRMKIHVIRVDDKLALIELSPLKYLERQLLNYKTFCEIPEELPQYYAKLSVLSLVKQMNKFIQMAANKKEVD